MRVIARLDVKAPNLVKGVHLEGLRVMGDPAEHAVRYYDQGVDEILYVDIVASLYERNGIADLVEKTADQIYVPLTVGGGIRSLEDIHQMLRAGADKVSINTAAVNNPSLITKASRVFGSQCIVVSVQAIRQPSGRWDVLTDNGRVRTGLNAVDWARRAVDLGAGEILLTSVDAEGTRKGFDCDLVAAIGPQVEVPVVACGGAGSIDDVAEVLKRGADAVAIASLLHYNLETVSTLKLGLKQRQLEVRL
ncbi:MAG: imidazole glycerol phosphate synthase subunit HisF [Roseimicrobium sp.]